jgi:hypothetical protein
VYRIWVKRRLNESGASDLFSGGLFLAERGLELPSFDQPLFPVPQQAKTLQPAEAKRKSSA